jgi:hypothetical protein
LDLQISFSWRLGEEAMEPRWRGEHGVQCYVSEDCNAQDHDESFLDTPDGWRVIGGDHLVRGEASRKSWLQASLAIAKIKCA